MKFLLETVSDPVCHQVFAKINDDESRHLVRLYRAVKRFKELGDRGQNTG